MNDNQLAFELKDIKLEDFHMEEVGSAPRCVVAVRTAAATTDCDSQREPTMGTAAAVRPCLGPALGTAKRRQYASPPVAIRFQLLQWPLAPRPPQVLL